MAADPSLLIVIATYNEIETLPPLVKAIAELLPSATILVVDDQSPDGTADWCVKFAAASPNFECIIREGKRGLGAATLEGLQLGLVREFDLIATMDGDFSHEPAYLVNMLNELLLQRADVVIGSRYVREGKIVGWPLHRHIASRFVNLLSRFWLGLKHHDNSGALRIYRSLILKKINLASIKSDGFAYLEEILFRLKKLEAKVIEIPIAFRNRKHGHSKTSLRVGIEKIWRILVMRFTK